MIIFSSSPTASCTLSFDKLTLDVFTEKAAKGTWTLLSHPEEEMQENVVSWPGEYDFEGMTVRGIGQEQGKQVSYVCTVDGLKCAFIDTPVLEWTDTDLQNLGDIDVLVIAAENQKRVTALVEAVDPRIVILLKTKDGDLAGIAKACGLKTMEPVSELKVKPGSLPTDARQVVILE